jgi:hypothetical protein
MRTGLTIFLMAAAAVAFGMMMKQCDSPPATAPTETKKTASP